MIIQLNERARVLTFDGENIGKLERVVINPRTRAVTHLVVEAGKGIGAGKGLGGGSQEIGGATHKVVPLEWVASGTRDEIRLGQAPYPIDQLPSYEEKHYVMIDERTFLEDEQVRNAPAPAMYWYPPLSGQMGPTYMDITGYVPNPAIPVTGDEEKGMTQRIDRNIPEDTVALQENAEVVAADGKTVGKVDRVFLDPESRRATHFLISRGFLFKTEKLVPEHWIQEVDEERVHLAVDSALLEKLPEYQE